MAVVDLRMPDINGLEVLRAIQDTDPDCQVILMSGDATIDSAVEAVKLGAIDYLTKPFDFVSAPASCSGPCSEEIARRAAPPDGRSASSRRSLEFCGMVGRGPAMQELVQPDPAAGAAHPHRAHHR